MSLPEWVKQIPGFKAMPVSEKIVVIGYFINEVAKLDRFSATAINNSFDVLHLDRPSNASSRLSGLATGGLKRLLRDAGGYRLNSVTREKVAAMLPKPVEVKQLVTELRKLEAQMTDPHQKTFLAETILCFSHGAFRAAIVMAWNLAYHHACSYILANHLAAFNLQMAKAFPKKKAVGKHSDFEDLQESDVIEIAKGAQIFSKATSGTMKAKLDIRNMAAHPSSTVVAPIKAEEVIIDLVQNVLLRPTL
jgi:hypothetical protein